MSRYKVSRVITHAPPDTALVLGYVDTVHEACELISEWLADTVREERVGILTEVQRSDYCGTIEECIFDTGYLLAEIAALSSPLEAMVDQWSPEDVAEWEISDLAFEDGVARYSFTEGTGFVVEQMKEV